MNKTPRRTRPTTILKPTSLATKIRPAVRSNVGERVLIRGGATSDAALAAIRTLASAEAGDIHRVDLSGVVSKYIGETEKNLDQLFRRAETKQWILFFDEADALFGKRSEVKDAHDRYANIEVSYLLSRLETFDGLAVLATNAQPTIDPAVLRRFKHVIALTPPKPVRKLVRRAPKKSR